MHHAITPVSHHLQAFDVRAHSGSITRVDATTLNKSRCVRQCAYMCLCCFSAARSHSQRASCLTLPQNYLCRCRWLYSSVSRSRSELTKHAHYLCESRAAAGATQQTCTSHSCACVCIQVPPPPSPPPDPRTALSLTSSPPSPPPSPSSGGITCMVCFPDGSTWTSGQRHAPQLARASAVLTPHAAGCDGIVRNWNLNEALNAAGSSSCKSIDLDGLVIRHR